MKQRERILLIVAGSVLGVLVLGLLARSLFVLPWREAQDKRRAAQATLASLRQEQSGLAKSVGAFAAWRDRTFADDANSAMLAADAQIKELAHQAGLAQAELNLSSFSEKPINKERELACTISSRRPVGLAKLVNFLFLLSRQGQLRTVSNLSIRPQDDSNSVNFSLRYATLVLADKPPLSIPARKAAASQTVAIDLAEVSQGTYAAIEGRNMFLPYVPLVHREPPPPQEPPAAAPSGDAADQMVVAGLPSTPNGPEVHIADAAGSAVKVLKVGERLPVGEIVAVDYREIPMPGKPTISSYSRVILRNGASYYAVELGQKLSERRVIQPSDMPPSLRFILEGQ